MKRVLEKQDKDSFAEIYDLYIEKIYRFIYFKISNKTEAEDLTSEVFLKLWDYLIETTEKEIQSFSGLIYKIARNSVVNHFRDKARRQECSVDYLENMSIDLARKDDIEKVETGIEAENIIKLLKKLKQEYQEVLVLKYIDELSTAEIAKILNKNQINVRVTIHRALNKLKELSE